VSFPPQPINPTAITPHAAYNAVRIRMSRYIPQSEHQSKRREEMQNGERRVQNEARLRTPFFLRVIERLWNSLSINAE
jgi:hypothetical protein